MMTKLAIFILTIFQMPERFEINSMCPIISPTRNWILCYSVIKVPETHLKLVRMNCRLISLELFLQKLTKRKPVWPCTSVGADLHNIIANKRACSYCECLEDFFVHYISRSHCRII